MSVKKKTLYLGWDGAYVLSSRPLCKRFDRGQGNYFLNSAGHLVDIHDREGAHVLGDLELAMFEVVKLEIVVTRKKRKVAA